MKKYREQWRQILAAGLGALAADAGAGAVDAGSIVVETPPRPEMGDIAFPMFPFAKLLKKAPPLIAREVVRRISESPSAQGSGQAIAEGQDLAREAKRTHV